MNLKTHSLFKNIVITTLFLFSSICKINSEKLFVNSDLCCSVLPLSKKIGDTLDQTRASIGDVITNETPLTINQPGNYILGEDIEDTISIESDDVYLDLNGYTIYENTGTSTAIMIQQEKRNIKIANGSLKGTTGNSSYGILVNKGTELVQVNNIAILDFTTGTGIYFDGTSDLAIKACEVKNSVIFNCNKAIDANYIIKSTFENCKAKNCLTSGFTLKNSQYNIFKRCNTLEIENNAPDTSIYGFSSTNGKGNLVLSCIAQGLSNILSNTGSNTVGFFKSNENGSKVIDCIANQIECSGYGNAYGIKVSESLDLKSTYTLDWARENDVANSIAWSPNGDYISYASSVREGSNENILIQVLDSSNLDVQLTYTLDWAGFQDQGLSVAWSPDGTQIAYAGKVTENSHSNIIVQVLDSSNLDLQLTYTLDWEGFDDQANSIAWSPDGETLVYGGQITDSSTSLIFVQTLDASNLSPQSTYHISYGPGNKDHAFSVAWSPDGNHIAYAGRADQGAASSIIVETLDPATLDVQQTYTPPWTGNINLATSVAWAPDGNNILYGGITSQNLSQNIIVEVLDSSSLDPQLTSTGDLFTGFPVGVAWSPNGKYIGYIGSINQIFDNNIILQVLNSSNLDPKFTYNFDTPEYQSAAYSLAWSPSGDCIGYTGYRTPQPANNNSNIVVETFNFSLGCSIINNETSNCIANQEGIGISGDDYINLIIKNLSFNNTKNFLNVSNVYSGSLDGQPGNLQNISA